MVGDLKKAPSRRLMLQQITNEKHNRFGEISSTIYFKYRLLLPIMPLKRSKGERSVKWGRWSIRTSWRQRFFVAIYFCDWIYVDHKLSLRETQLTNRKTRCWVEWRWLCIKMPRDAVLDTMTYDEGEKNHFISWSRWETHKFCIKKVS